MRYRYRADEEMKDSGVEWIGKIPKGVEQERLKYDVKFEKGSNPKNLNINYEGLPYVGASDFGNKNYKIFTTDTNLPICDREDLLILWDGARAGIVDYGHEGVVSSTIVKVKNLSENIYSKYFNWYMKSFEKYFIDMSNGTTIPHMNRKFIENLHIIKFPIDYQKKITNFLDEKTSDFDNIISKKEKLIEKLEEAKKSLISEVVTGKVKVVKNGDDFGVVKRNDSEMKDSGVEWIGKIPKDWKIKRLRFLGKLQNGISKSSDEFGYGYPFVSYSNAYKNIELPVEIEGLVNSTEDDRRIYSVKEGDVLFTRTSETVEEIGFASTCMNTIENATFAGFLIRFRPNNTNILYKGFSKYYFRCELNRKFFVKEMNLVTRASLSQNLLNNLSVALPSYNEQVEIYNALELKVGGINLSIDKLKYQIEKLKEAKQALISEAVTGKIEILD